MIRNLKRYICFVLIAVTLCVCFSGCGDKSETVEVKAKSYSKAKLNMTSPESGIIAKSASFSIEWNSEKKTVKFNDLKTGKIYSNVPTGISGEIRYDDEGMPIKNNPQIESAVSVSYYDYTTMEEKTLHSYISTDQNENVSAELIDNGIRVIYNFADDSIIVPVDYTVKDDCFNISVEPSEIYDDGINYVTGVSVAPFICGVENDSKDSYLFIPDGSGAIIMPKTLSTSGTAGSMPVYGGDRAVSRFVLETYTEQCYLPIFGMKSGDTGLCAIIDSAAERSYINWNIGSSNIRYSTVYPYFRIMGYNLIKKPSGFANGFSDSSPETKAFNGSINPESLSVSYYPINGSKCGYNDMAKIYREYLIKNYGLTKNQNADIKLSLEIEGGIEDKRFFCGVPYTGFIPLTTIQQATEITEYFSDISNGMLVRLGGFTENGLNIGKLAGGFKINSKLGSENDIYEMTDYCNKNGIVLSLDFNITAFNDSGGGYGIKKSSAFFSDYNINYLSAYDEVTRNSNGVKYFLTARSLFPDILKKASVKVTDYGFNALGVGDFGKTVYSDYREKESYNCDGIQENITNGIKAIQKNSSIVMTGANDYAACAGDYITNAPTASSGYDIITYEVPFYSMVFKGYVSMSSGAVNLSADENKMLLKCIEAGISPTYTLMYNFSRDLITTGYPVTRSSEYFSLRQSIANIAMKTKAFFEAVDGAEIVNHKIVDTSVRTVKYSNGATVYINYSTENAVADGISIPAESYIVMGGKA